MKTILSPLIGSSIDESTLKASRVIGSVFGSHITCLHVRPDPTQIIAASTPALETATSAALLSAEIWDSIQEANERAAKLARDTFGSFCANNNIRDQERPSASIGISASWRETEGNFDRLVTSAARVNDLLVLGRSLEDGEISSVSVGRILSGCGRPVLLVPCLVPNDPPNTIAIAWKETAEAARAVTAAMPLLQKASRIVVLTANEDQEAAQAEASAHRLSEQLRWHGFKSEAHHVPPDMLYPAEAVMGVASDMGVDLIVMGAYSHSRAYEFIFGGFTRHALKHAALPVLMVH